MLYQLLYSLREHIGAFNVFRYITFRSALATLTALVLSLGLGRFLIEKLRTLQIGQHIREEGPRSHYSKKGTPTMGGILIVVSVVIPVLLWADLSNIFIWLAVGSMVAFSLIGFVDDYRKIAKRHNLGLTARTKLGWQILVAAAIGVILVSLAENDLFTTRLSLPFLKQWTPDIGWFYVVFIVMVIVGAANAVNLTDGLDGLAIGSVLIAASTFAILSYVVGHAVAAGYLGIINVKGAGELTVFCGALVGACLGFLWYNCNPAEVFMGDVGSMALGRRDRHDRGAHQAGVPARHGRRPVRHRGPLRHHPGHLVPVDRAPRLPDGAAAPPLRIDGMARAQGHHPFLDHLDPFRAAVPVHAEAAVIR